MKLRILTLLILTILVSSIALAVSEEVRQTPQRMHTTAKAFGPTNYGPDLKDEVAKARNIGKDYGNFLPVEAIDSIGDHQLRDTIFYDSIHIADVQGRPKYEFSGNENIYLKDRRQFVSPRDWFPDNDYERWAVMYPPNTEVHIYLLRDLTIFESELDRFRFLQSSFHESKTRQSPILKKYVVNTDEEGRLPFLNLGRVTDIAPNYKFLSSGQTSREGYNTNNDVASGQHGTYDYSDTRGNRLSDRNYIPPEIGFDIFIDADRNGMFNSLGDTVYVGKYRMFDSDHYLYHNSPAFAVKTNTLKVRETCCVCEESERVFFEMSDTYSCQEYCGSIEEEIVEFIDGTCSGAPIIEEDIEFENNIEEDIVEEVDLELDLDLEPETEEESFDEQREGDSSSFFNMDRENLNLLIAVVVFVVLLLLLLGVVASSSKKGALNGKK